MKTFLISAALSLLLAAPAWANPEKLCGKLVWNYGPFDYRSANSQQRGLVENAHFDEGVQTLTKGMTGPFGGDIGYTLNVFPNHPLALVTMERLVEKDKKNPPTGSKHTIECWYERALRFRPDDHVPRLLYANFLIKKQRTDEATKHLDYVAATTQDNPFAQFNTGMLYMDMKAYDKALTQAHRVIELGVERPELRDRLTAVGRWVEPPASAAASAASQP
jgi:tetratricopeptide (TPR) repeat protein